MAMDFPASPTVGAIYSPAGGPSYRWDGSLWVPQQGIAVPVLSGRNKIINGNMRINQRGLLTTSTAGAFLADRWSLQTTVGVSMLMGDDDTVSRVGRSYVYFKTTTAKPSLAAGDFASISYSAEGNDWQDLLWGTPSAKPITVSFRAQASVATVISVTIRNDAADRSYCVPVTIGTAAADYQVTIPGCPDGNWPKGVARAAQLWFTFANGTTYMAPVASAWQNGNYVAPPGISNGADTLNRWLSIADVQIEEGVVRTPFELRLLATEMTLCQRYFEAGAVAIISNAYAATMFVGGFVSFNTPKRIPPPTITLGAPSENANITGTPAVAALGVNGFRIYAGATAAGPAYYTGTFTAYSEF